MKSRPNQHPAETNIQMMKSIHSDTSLHFKQDLDDEVALSQMIDESPYETRGQRPLVQSRTQGAVEVLHHQQNHNTRLLVPVPSAAVKSRLNP